MIDILEINKEISVAHDASDIELSEMPKWVEFMIWAGWFMRSASNGNRQVMVLLLPERYCCSAFCSLGALFAGAKEVHNSMSWDAFSGIPIDSTFYLLYGYKGNFLPVEGELCDNENIDESRRVRIKSRNKNINQGLITVTPSNIDKYQVSLTPHASQIKLGKLAKLSRFLKKFVDGYQESWIVSDSVESVVVTNKAAWKREIENINVILNHTDVVGLDKLLMHEEVEGASAGHTKIVAAETIDNIDNTSLIILDGASSLKKWDRCMQSNLIILLSKAEHAEESMDILKKLSSYRDDNGVEEINFDPARIMPGETEMMMFSLPKSE